MIRTRTIREAAAYFKERDPNTCLTETAIRTLLRNGAVPCARVGKKYLVAIEALEIYLVSSLSKKYRNAAAEQRRQTLGDSIAFKLRCVTPCFFCHMHLKQFLVLHRVQRYNAVMYHKALLKGERHMATKAKKKYTYLTKSNSTSRWNAKIHPRERPEGTGRKGVKGTDHGQCRSGYLQ